MQNEAPTAGEVVELLEQIARRLHSQGYASQLFPAQWSALRYLRSAPPHLRTAIDLARFQGLAPGAVARTVRTLIAKGYLIKIGTVGRGRAEQLEVTEQGKSLFRKDPLRIVENAIETLDHTERAILAKGLTTAIRATRPGDKLDNQA